MYPGSPPGSTLKAGGQTRKTGMKSKTFRADGADAIIKAVNDWLAGETGIQVRRTETKPAVPRPGEPVEFCVWYEQHEART